MLLGLLQSTVSMPLKSMLNTVCGSYLKHPASEEMLAAHSAER